MVTGLQERERIRDLCERHVGEDVARDAIGREAEIGGEVRHVAVLFVDVVGSTQLASRLPPTEVVALLNRFFSVAVDVVGHHQGLVNKRSEEHTSELQSLMRISYAVFCLKKKKQN